MRPWPARSDWNSLALFITSLRAVTGASPSLKMTTTPPSDWRCWLKPWTGSMEAYVQFARTPGGATYNRQAMAAVRDVLVEATERYMAAIPKAMERRKGAVGT